MSKRTVCVVSLALLIGLLAACTTPPPPATPTNAAATTAPIVATSANSAGSNTSAADYCVSQGGRVITRRPVYGTNLPENQQIPLRKDDAVLQF